MQRWDDTDKNYGILLSTERTLDFARKHDGYILLSKGGIITVVCDKSLGFPLWEQVWRRPTPQERHRIPGIRPSLEFDYRVVNDIPIGFWGMPRLEDDPEASVVIAELPADDDRQVQRFMNAQLIAGQTGPIHRCPSYLKGTSLCL